PQPLTELMAYLRRSDRTKFRQSVVEPLLEAGWLARTVPDRPRSRFQQYVTTPAGREFLEIQEDRQLDEEIQAEARGSGYEEEDAVEIVRQYRRKKKGQRVAS
ncbi:MAG: Fic family protein, partial [Blastocatellia bacterium]